MLNTCILDFVNIMKFTGQTSTQSPKQMNFYALCNNQGMTFLIYSQVLNNEALFCHL